MRMLLASLFIAAGLAAATPAFADGCYLCGSGSSNGCQQCRYGDKDTQDKRKACESRGCKITGTGSCSSAANVKVCQVETSAPVEAIAWCAAQ